MGLGSSLALRRIWRGGDMGDFISISKVRHYYLEDSRDKSMRCFFPPTSPFISKHLFHQLILNGHTPDGDWKGAYCYPEPNCKNGGDPGASQRAILTTKNQRMDLETSTSKNRHV
jgi:hypothetical protein